MPNDDRRDNDRTCQGDCSMCMFANDPDKIPASWNCRIHGTKGGEKN